MAAIINWMSLSSIPAFFIAILAASTARSEADSPLLAILLSLIPVLVVIHSSLVSTIFSRSAFVRRFSGAYAPSPTIPTALPLYIFHHPGL